MLIWPLLNHIHAHYLIFKIILCWIRLDIYRIRRSCLALACHLNSAVRQIDVNVIFDFDFRRFFFHWLLLVPVKHVELLQYMIPHILFFWVFLADIVIRFFRYNLRLTFSYIAVFTPWPWIHLQLWSIFEQQMTPAQLLRLELLLSLYKFVQIRYIRYLWILWVLQNLLYFLSILFLFFFVLQWTLLSILLRFNLLLKV